MESFGNAVRIADIKEAQSVSFSGALAFFALILAFIKTGPSALIDVRSEKAGPAFVTGDLPNALSSAQFVPFPCKTT